MTVKFIVRASTLAIAISLSSAHATDFTWGGGALDWNDTSASGWNGGPPGGGDTATIISGTVTLSTNNLTNPLASVTIGGTGKLTQTTGNSWNALNNLTLGGGTLESVKTSGEAFGSYQISNTAHVTGSSASTISTSGTGSIFINLGQAVNNSPTFTTFDVSDVTSSPAADLAVSTVLGNNIATDFVSSSAAGLIKTGAGTMTLSANNIYTAGTTVDNGVLEIAGSSAGNSHIRGTVTVNNGAELRYTGGDGTGFGFSGGNKLDTINLNGGLVNSHDSMTHLWAATVNMTGGELRVNGGTSDTVGNRIEWNNSTVNTFASASTATISGRINLRGDGGYSTAVFNVADGPAATDLLVSAAITESTVPFGSVGITKTGEGTMVLTGTNSYAGTTTVAGGTLSIVAPTIDDASTVVIALGASMHLDFTGDDIISNIEIAGSGLLPPGTYNSSHPIYGSYFTGNGSLVIPSANGTWYSLADGNWSDAANWDGNIIAAGFNATAAFSDGAGVTVTVDSSRKIGNLVFDVSDYTLAGAGILTLDASGIPAISVASGRTATISAPLAGTDGMEKTGEGTLVFTGAKSYGGGTIVSGGTLELQGATGGNAQIHGALAVSPGATVALTGGDGTGFGFFNNPVTSITVNGGTINAAGGSHLGFGTFMTMTLDNGSALQGSWQWNGDTMLGFSSFGDSTNTISGYVVLRADGGANHTLTVADGAAAVDLQIDAVLADQWPEENAVPASSLTKSGNGTLELGGNNTYDGNTVVNTGVLSVAAAGGLRFRPTTNGTTNSVAGSASAWLSFLGTVNLDLGGADATLGNSWNLFNLASFTGPVPVLTPAAVTSTLGAFSEVTSGRWELPVTGAKWVFTEIDGNLSYVSAVTDYDSWKSTNGVTGGENDDDDADGLTNHEEYAFGLDPTDSSMLNPIAVPLDTVAGTFSYTRRTQSLTGLAYSVWSSTDLVTWAPATFTELVSGPVANVETVQVTLTPAPTAPIFFVQVRAD